MGKVRSRSTTTQSQRLSSSWSNHHGSSLQGVVIASPRPPVDTFMDGVVRATQVLAVQTGMDTAFVPPSAAESVDGNRKGSYSAYIESHGWSHDTVDIKNEMLIRYQGRS